MQKYKIKSLKNRKFIFNTKASSFKRCVEKAIEQNIDLSHADLSDCNLSNANLDGGILDGANFTNTNLTGANMSECSAKGANFSNADLYNTCLAYADCTGVDFQYANFGATDITAANISQSIFAGYAWMKLDFVKARKMTNCAFLNQEGTYETLNTPPLIILGINQHPVLKHNHRIKPDTHKILNEPHLTHPPKKNIHHQLSKK